MLGEEAPRVEHLAQLRYIEQILMEALRIWPTASVFSVSPHKDTVLGGKYPLTTKDIVMVLEPMLHRDPKVWGDDVEAFRPERFAPENASQLPPNAWKPFGNGARACIGRPFAMQEAQLVLILMLQRFDFVLDDPSYTLKIHETLTLKPEGLRIRARSRRTGATSLRRSAVPSTPQKPLTLQPARQPASDAAATPLLILYGSNTGSSEAFANRIADEAPANGFAPTVAAMDDHAGNLPRDGAIVVVTASYEGQRPTMPASSCPMSNRYRRARSRARASPCSAAATGNGRAPTRRFPSGSTRLSPGPAPGGSPSAARPTRAATSSAPSTNGGRASCRACARHWARTPPPLRRRPACRSSTSRTVAKARCGWATSSAAPWSRTASWST